MQQWYEKLFENYANNYDNQPYVTGTIGEVDFIEKEINYEKSKSILDIGCGTGRHSIELAKRGYNVTGFDLSDAQLNKARKKAAAAKVNINFFRQDSRTFSFSDKFDLAIMICEGSFSLMETDEMNFAILENAYNALNPDGKLIFTTLNGLFPLFHSVKDFINNAAGKETSKENSFDLMTFRDHSTFETTDDDGKLMKLNCNERYYVPSEINWQLKSIGFNNIRISGCKLGAWNADDILSPEDYEMLVVAEK